jgi:ribosome-binding factor A
MPTPRRVARLQQLILETAATAVQRELSDPRLGFVTLTHVKLAPDLTAATVYWSCLGTDADRRTSARALEDATPVIQSVVAGALATRTTPTLTFRYDPSLAHAERLEGIFEQIKRERGDPPSPDSPPPAPPTDDEPRDDGDED